MSTHPNAILMLVITPDDLPWKTYKGIIGDRNDDDTDIKIDGENYHTLVSQGYHEGFQIAADEGDIVIFDLVTYGYGKAITWDKLEAQKKQLEAWAEEHKGEFKFSKYEIRVSANYW